MRSARTGWGAGLVLGAGLMVGATTGCVPVRYTEAFTPDEPVTRVRITLERGSVTLVPADTLRVERAVRGAQGSVELASSVDGDGVLALQAACPTLLPCGVDTRIALPPDVPVTVSLGAGEVWATGVDDLRVDVADGDVDVEVRERLVVSVGTGSVRAWLGGDTDASVTVARGSVDVVVPPGPYALDVSGSDRTISGVTPDDDAPGRLQVVAPAGPVSVRGAQGVARR
jgi:hypothetical protein